MACFVNQLKVAGDIDHFFIRTEDGRKLSKNRETVILKKKKKKKVDDLLIENCYIVEVICSKCENNYPDDLHILPSRETTITETSS